MITSTDEETEMDGHLSEGNMFNGLSAVDRNRCMSCCVVIDKEPMNSGTSEYCKQSEKFPLLP